MAEGIKMFEEAPKEKIRKVYVAESFLAGQSHDASLGHVDCEVLSDKVFRAVCDTQTPQGILTLVSVPSWEREVIWKKDGACFLLLESIQDPGNLGTMLRTAECAGFDAVIANRTTVDLYNPKTIRSTMGSIYRMPYFVAEDLAEVVENLKSGGTKIYAAHLSGRSCYDESDYRTSCGFFIGNEGNGLTEETAALADERIRIPMAGNAESLNASVAASILMYEVNRQRRGKTCFDYGQKK